MTEVQNKTIGAAAVVRGPEPNIRYVRRKLQLDKKTGAIAVQPVGPDNVPTYRKDGEMEFKLPSGEAQIAGFHHPDAVRLMRAWPKDFKRIGKGKVVRPPVDTAGDTEETEDKTDE